MVMNSISPPWNQPLKISLGPFILEGGRKPQSYDGGYATDNVLASYLHLNFAGSLEGAKHFCRYV